MKKIVELIAPDNIFNIYWTLTDFCNFRCNYCWPELHSGDCYSGRKPGYPTNEEITTFIDTLIEKHLPGRRLRLAIGGGEPTLHPMFETIVERLSPYGEIAVTTNGSRNFEWWKNLPVLPNLVTISLHPEFSKMDKINENAKFLVESGVIVRFNVNCDPANWTGTVSMYDSLLPELQKFALPKVLNHLWSDNSTYDYTPEQMQWIKHKQTKFNVMVWNKQIPEASSFKVKAVYDDGTTGPMPRLADMTLKKQHGFRNWDCEAGMTTLNVYFDGNVWGSVCKSKVLGRLDNFETLQEPIKCGVDWCPCPTDIIINKRMIPIQKV